MGKEIILPWTCETSDKLMKIFRYVILIGYIPGILWSPFYNIHTSIELICISAVLLGLAFTSTILFLLQIDYPSFKCKSNIKNNLIFPSKKRGQYDGTMPKGWQATESEPGSS